MEDFLDVLRKFFDESGGKEYSLARAHTYDIPLDAEVVLTNTWEMYEKLSDVERANLRKKLDLSVAARTLPYAVRMATLAVRTEDERLLYFSVLALTVDDHLLDERDVSCVCSVVHDASVRVGVDPIDIFTAATKYSAGRRRQNLEYFYRDSPGYMKVLSSMGFEAMGEGDDFSYRDSLT